MNAKINSIVVGKIVFLKIAVYPWHLMIYYKLFRICRTCKACMEFKSTLGYDSDSDDELFLWYGWPTKGI